MTPRPTVLVIDDDEDLRQISMHTLDQVDPGREFDHLEASDGEHGIALIDQLVQDSAPLLVLCDYRMPRMDGAEVAARVAHHRARVPLRFILLSSIGSLGGQDLRHQSGVDEVLEKAFKPKEWRAQFGEVLRAWSGELAGLNHEPRRH